MPGLKTNLFAKHKTPVAAQSIHEREERTNTAVISDTGEPALNAELESLLTYHLPVSVGLFVFLSVLDVPAPLSLSVALIAAVYTISEPSHVLSASLEKLVKIIF